MSVKDVTKRNAGNASGKNVNSDADFFDRMEKGEGEDITLDYWKPTGANTNYSFKLVAHTIFKGKDGNRPALILTDRAGKKFIASQAVLCSALGDEKELPIYFTVKVLDLVQGENGEYFNMKVLVLKP